MVVGVDYVVSNVFGWSIPTTVLVGVWGLLLGMFIPKILRFFGVMSG